MTAARAIWKGHVVLGRQRVPVKLYSAVEDRKVRFRLLHAKDRAPVEQHIVRKDNGKEVAKEDQRKAFQLDRDTAVMLQPEELEQLEPPASQDIHLCRWVSPTLLNDQWYDRPYYLGPDEDEESYFAFAAALERKKLIGIARWVMRRKRYLGALTLTHGYLAMITLRRAEQVLSFSGIELARSATPSESEFKLAEQLVSSITGDFDPGLWQDEYRQRLQMLIDAKARGERIALPKPRKKAAEATLADSLKASIAAAREQKVA